MILVALSPSIDTFYMGESFSFLFFLFAISERMAN